MNKYQNHQTLPKPHEIPLNNWHDFNINDDIRYEMIKDIFNTLVDHYDESYGGFGVAPKLPNTSVIHFLFEYYFDTHNEKAKEMIRYTLIHMAEGEIFDHENGGFFTHANQQDWQQPSYEKNLETNALLLDLYIKAYQLFHEDKYKLTAQKIIHYLTTQLMNEKKNAFYHGTSLMKNNHQQTEYPWQHVHKTQIDQTIYTDENAMVISAFLKAYQAFRIQSCLQIALKALDFLLMQCYDREKGMLHYNDGTPHMPGLLKDQIFMIHALIDAYETTGEKYYLEKAVEIGEMVYDMFYDKIHGGFFEAFPYDRNHGEILATNKSIENNGIAAQALLRLYNITEEWVFYDISQINLSSFVAQYKQAGYHAASYGTGVNYLLHNANYVTLVGDIENDKLYELLYECNKFYISRKAVKILDHHLDRDRIDDLGYDASPNPKVYLCIDKLCLPPIQNPTEVRSAFLRLQQHERINHTSIRLN